ncbi:hypothetical protein R6Q57_016747 [Mikania cordata]
MAEQHSDEGVGGGHATIESVDSTSVTDKQFNEHVSADNVAGQSLESTGVEDEHFDGDLTASNVSVRSLGSESKGVADKHSDEGESVAEAALVADNHSDKGDRIAEVALESLKSKTDSDKHLDEDAAIAEVALVADKHTDKSDRIAEVALESLKLEDKHSDEGDRIAEVALENLKSKGVADKHSDEGEEKDEAALETIKIESFTDKHLNEGESIAEVALETLKSKGVTNNHSEEGENMDEAALEGMKSKSVANKHSDEGGSIAKVAHETLKSKGVSDKHSDECVDVHEVALESLKSKNIADNHLDEGESIAEVALETLNSNSVADKYSDEGAITTNPLKYSDSMGSESTMEINIKTLDSQLHNFVVDKNMPVSKFKENIASEIGLSVEQQRLIFRGKMLKDDDLLSEYYVENGHTLHLVARQPSEFQLSSNSPNVEPATRSSNSGQDDNVTGTHPHVGHVTNSVVLGTFGVGDQDEGGSSDINQVIEAVLNFVGTGGQGTIGGTGTAQPHMQFSIPMQVVHGNETGNQFHLRGPNQSMPQGYQTPSGSVPAVPTLATPIPESLHTISEFVNNMNHALSQNGTKVYYFLRATENFPSVELPSNAHGLPSPAALAVVMRHTQRLLSGPAVDSLSHAARRLEEEEGSSDVTVRTQIQTEAMQSGLAMQHLGALLLELGRTMLTLRIGQSPAETSVNAGPAVYISPSGPNPIMVQPFPLQTNSLFGGNATPALNHGTFGPVGIGAIPRHVNIHIHPGQQLTKLCCKFRCFRRTIRIFGYFCKTWFSRYVPKRKMTKLKVATPDAGDTGNVTSSSTRMKSSSETEGGSSSTRRNIPLGLGQGSLQPKRRQRQTRSEASSSGVSTSYANQSLQSSGGQLDPATIMNQVMQNPALNNLLAGVSNQNGAGSPDFFGNFMTQLSKNPEMMNTVNQLAQQMDGNQDLTSMLTSMGGSSGGGGSGNLDMSSLVQQMMPFVSQALNSGSSTSSSNMLQSLPSRKGMLHRRSSSVKSLNTHERSGDFQMNLENAAQKIVEHYPPLEIFSSIIQTAAAYRNNVYDTSAINELCMEEELAQEFSEMLKRDISRRLQ